MISNLLKPFLKTVLFGRSQWIILFTTMLFLVFRNKLRPLPLVFKTMISVSIPTNPVIQQVNLENLSAATGWKRFLVQFVIVRLDHMSSSTLKNLFWVVDNGYMIMVG